MIRDKADPAPGYADDLAYIHDQGYGGFASGSAPGLLNLFRQHGLATGTVVDLGCGSGIWSRELVLAGYQVVGVDQSQAMIEIARARVAGATFHTGSFLQFSFPSCHAVTAMGEVFNYLFDTDNSIRSLKGVCEKVFDALVPGGILVFDVAEPGRSKGQSQRWSAGKDWACLVEVHQHPAKQQLSRKIVSFRKVGDTYRRHEETHTLQLYQGTRLAQMLRAIGFRVRTMRGYGKYRFPPAVVGLVARKPG